MRAYGSPQYRMGSSRRGAVHRYITALDPKGSLLDVGTGRGETLAMARGLGFERVMGTEVVPALIDGDLVVRAEVHDLPFADNEFDWVTMFDVMEHLIPGDDELAVRELCRVARHGVVVTIANFPSVKDGEVLHINLRPYREWDELLRAWCPSVEWLPNHGSISEAWKLGNAGI
jgi:SAM-dependent methyltransferase